MRRKTLWAFVFAIGFAFTSQAVVIHWATEGVPSGATSAQLVYVASGVPSYTSDVLSNGSALGAEVSGLAITPVGVGEQSTADGARSQGSYFVMLFRTVDDVSYFSYSTTSLAYDNTTAITYDAMAPATGVFSPGTFSEWTPIPEPSAALLLGLGAAALSLRRRRHV